MAEERAPGNDSQDLSPKEENLIRAALEEGEGDSALPRELVAEDRREPSPERLENLYQRVMKMGVPQKIRLAMLGNQDARNLLIHDSNKVVSQAVLRSPKITENEVQSFAQQKSLPLEILAAIARNKIWMKNYQVKLALAANPKTPLTTSIKLLDHLHDKDLQGLSRNKNVSSILARSAARVLIKRGG